MAVGPNPSIQVPILDRTVNSSYSTRVTHLYFAGLYYFGFYGIPGPIRAQ